MFGFAAFADIPFSGLPNTYVSLSESVTLTDTITVVGTYLSDVGDNLLVLDTQSCSVSIDLVLTEPLLVGDTSSASKISTVSITSSLVLLDSVTGRYLWEPIDDTQTANWGNISTTQTANWGSVDTSQTSNWDLINT